MSDGLDIRLRWTIAAALVLAALVTWGKAGFFGQSLLAELAIFAIFAMSVDLVAGLVGLMSIGHAMYFGFGAYAVALLTTELGVSAGTALLLAVAGAAVVAALVGAVIVRFSEIIFIMLTLALSEMFYAFIFGNRTLGGSDGIAGVPRLDLSPIGLDGEAPEVFSAVTVVAAVITFALLDALARSPFGLVAAAVRQKPSRARALGTRINLVRTVVYALSAALAALAGALMAQLNNFASPDLAGWTLSGLVLIMAILGGLGSISGAALGAIIVQAASHFLSRWTGYWGFFLGVSFIAVVMFAENGLFALLRRPFVRRAARLLPGPEVAMPPVEAGR
ncbi:branched-chain amino acid ABC transporter permease [Roseomonas sp. CCTCC AB2023176]|uniref:branched-chain amino acid ABC transporter permease n=1 Tax=Roseomonas sp. CCTCC AB2023176 TaxID=3342640 RepID=UPI0035D56B07